MLNIIWLGLILLSVFIAAINGKSAEVVASVTASAKFAFEIALDLTGIMAFWLGLMRIAEESGLVQVIARLLRPIMTRLFPDVPADHPAMGAMILNISANMLGLNNAATPFGLKAMAELDTLNKQPGTATNAMCTFLALNTAGLQIIPTTAIAYLATAGAIQPTRIIATTFVATCCALAAGLITAKLLANSTWFRLTPSAEIPEESKK